MLSKDAFWLVLAAYFQYDSLMEHKLKSAKENEGAFKENDNELENLLKCSREFLHK